MPTYEYACEACKHAFEEFQSITAAPLKKCPKCGKSKLKRLIGTGGGLIFKGSGFYITDYRSDSYKKAAEAAKSGESGKASDSKPADTGGATGKEKSETAKPPAAGTEVKAEKPSEKTIKPVSVKSKAKSEES